MEKVHVTSPFFRCKARADAHHREHERRQKETEKTYIIACIALGACACSPAGFASAISNAFSADWTASATVSSMEPFSFGSTTALAEVEDLFDVEASLNEATLWQVLMVCKENIIIV